MNDARLPAHDLSLTATHSGGDGRDLLDRLAEEFTERCRRGESPTVVEYEERYPEHAEQIRTFLPTVALMEQLKRAADPSREPVLSRAIPERLGEFRVVRELGRGGMGVVYEAVQESLGRHVALKVIHHIHLDARRLQRFQREAQAVARLHHTNIVPIFGAGEHEGLPYYVMQYIQGNGLDAIVGTWRDTGSIRSAEHWRLVATIGEQAARALQYAHEQGILHRDIKPANLLIDEQRTVWITDFGLAKLTGHDDLTHSGDVIGTLRYLAPESLRGETDPRSDVYSLGLTLYELLTLTPPFGELTPSELLRHVGEGQPLRPRRIDASIPHDLETIVLKATAREPNHRYPDARALAEDLRRYLDDRPILARRVTPFEHLWRWARRNRATAAMTATATISLMLAALVGWVANARTTKALQRESQNVALSLEAFGDLFDKLAPSDNLLPPPPSRSGRPSGPPRDGPGGPPPDDRGENGPFGPGGPPPDDNPFGMARGRGGPESNTALLRSVLTYYDRFARQNATNPSLQGEAAWAYRRVGALYDRIGREDEAALAYARAITIFKDLAAQFPRDVKYRSRLVETYIMADPWTARSSTLESLKDDFTHAQALVDQLAAEQPDSLEHIQSQVHVYAKLGAVLQRLKQDSAAEDSYRRAIQLGGTLIERSNRPLRAQVDRAMIRETLAELQIERNQLEAARSTLVQSAEELISLISETTSSPMFADRFESLANLYQRLEEPARADEMVRRAEEIHQRAPRDHRRPGGPPPDGRFNPHGAF